MHIKIKKIEIPLDPPINVFAVEIEGEGNIWKESISSEESLRWFLRGISAGASMYGDTYITLPEIPTRTHELREVLEE